MKAVNLRELKNRLGTYVREVRAGETILVTDRGEVVAELRKPVHDARVVTTLEEKLDRLAREGKITRGLPHDPSIYRRRRDWSVPPGTVERLLDAEREDMDLSRVKKKR